MKKLHSGTEHVYLEVEVQGVDHICSQRKTLVNETWPLWLCEAWRSRISQPLNKEYLFLAPQVGSKIICLLVWSQTQHKANLEMKNVKKIRLNNNKYITCCTLEFRTHHLYTVLVRKHYDRKSHIFSAFVNWPSSLSCSIRWQNFCCPFLFPTGTWDTDEERSI